MGKIIFEADDETSYMNCVILRLIRKYNLTEDVATRAVKESFLYEFLQKYPADTMHDSVNTVADDVYSEIFGMA